MKMRRRVSEVKREYRIKNKYLRGVIGVTSIVDKIRKNRLK